MGLNPNATLGNAADAASTQGGAGSLSAKMRLITTQLNTLAGAVPTGGATAAKQDTGNTSLASLVAALLAEDAVHASGAVGLIALVVRRDTAASSSGTDGDNSTLNVDSTGRLWTHQGGLDSANDLQKVTPKSAIGSGGQLAADGILHTGACTLLGLCVSAGATGGSIAFTDGTAAGTVIFTIQLLAGTSFVTDLPGIALGTGLYADFTTIVGGTCTAFVGPAVS